MANYITLQFINGEILLLSTSSFLFRYSKLLQSFDIEEDNEIPIICLRSYIIDKNNMCLFDNKTDLSFMFTLQPNKFLEVCKFLDIICYENKDTLFSKEFIIYVMTNIKEEINIIKYFMQPEIRSIMNYINNEDINIQIRTCTLEFYHLFLTTYKEVIIKDNREEVIKNNRIDLYNSISNKNKLYRYIHKYENQLTYMVKGTQEYNDYMFNINQQLRDECRAQNLNNMKKLVKHGATVNFQDKYNTSVLHNASHEHKNIKIIKFLVKNGANVNLQNNKGENSLHLAIRKWDNFEIVKYLVENGADVNLQNIYGQTALHIASDFSDNIDVIKYLIKHGANIHLLTNCGNTILHYVSRWKNNLKVIQYVVKNGVNVNLQNNQGYIALDYASLWDKNGDVINYLLSIMYK